MPAAWTPTHRGERILRSRIPDLCTEGCAYCSRLRDNFHRQCRWDGSDPSDLSSASDAALDSAWALLPAPPPDADEDDDPEPPDAPGGSVQDPEPEEPEATTRRWKKIGVELEGGWNNVTWDALKRRARASGADLKGDGSVTASADTVGEIATRPYVRLGNAIAAVDRLYPDVVNSSCGMHVHASFDDIDYGALMTPHFYYYFLLRWQSWGQRLNIRNDEFWSRLRGDNQYCHRKFIPYSNMRSADRYTQLNFCYDKHGTVECRLLPMFKEKNISKRAVEELASIYEDYLAQYGDHPAEDVEMASIGDDVPEAHAFEITLEDEPPVATEFAVPGVESITTPVPPGTVRVINIGQPSATSLARRIREAFGHQDAARPLMEVL